MNEALTAALLGIVAALAVVAVEIMRARRRERSRTRALPEVPPPLHPNCRSTLLPVVAAVAETGVTAQQAAASLSAFAAALPRLRDYLPRRRARARPPGPRPRADEVRRLASEGAPSRRRLRAEGLRSYARLTGNARRVEARKTAGHHDPGAWTAPPARPAPHGGAALA